MLCNMILQHITLEINRTKKNAEDHNIQFLFLSINKVLADYLNPKTT